MQGKRPQRKACAQPLPLHAANTHTATQRHGNKRDGLPTCLHCCLSKIVTVMKGVRSSPVSTLTPEEPWW